MGNLLEIVWKIIACGCLCLGLFACKPEPVDPGPTPFSLTVPDHFRTPEIPADNPLTIEGVALGKKLFYDPILSVDSSTSCASCHEAKFGFAEDKVASLGVENQPTDRNSMALINLVYGQAFFWDGRESSLEDQALKPIFNPEELNSTESEVLKKLRRHPDYPRLFQAAFGDSVSLDGLAKALSSFERILISSGSKYDQFVASGGDSTLFTESEWRGYNLFFTEKLNTKHAECFHCHGGFNFDDPAAIYQNNGLYEFYDDLGRAEVSQRPEDVGKFKVPTLRNIEFTAPYMHDGSLHTLEEVLDHYGSGGKPHPRRSPLVANISLNEQEKQDVIAFLKTLSDPDFLTNPAFLAE